MGDEDGYYEEEGSEFAATTGPGWCFLEGQGGGFLKTYTDYSSSSLFLDVTDALRGGKSLQLMAMAMDVGGAYADDFGQLARLGMPLESTMSTMFELRLSDDGVFVDVYRPQLALRSTDPQSGEALRRGAGSGWIGSFATIACNNNGEMAPRGQLPPELRGRRIVIDGAGLIQKGFIVAPEAPQGARTYRLLNVQVYPQNLDVTVEFLYMGPRASVQVGFSVVVLPEKPMPPRASDDRLLYFTTDYTDLGQRMPPPKRLASEAVDRQVSMIWRYNLAALPDHQIKLYVDPTIPKRWRKYVREGIEAWNLAFEAIGFPRAVRAVLPEDVDWPADYDMNDARFNTISWSISDEVSSMGIAKVDPRSGEILKSDIIMSDGWVKSWLSDLDLSPNQTRSSSWSWQAAGTDERRSREAKADALLAEQLVLLSTAKASSSKSKSAEGAAETRKELIGAGIRNVVMHETGHILGLRHNFKGSLGVSYECTQDISCSAVHGLASSVMDYLPMNLPLTPGKEVHAFSTVIGAYDKLAIAYGYMNVTEPGPIADGVTPPELEAVLREAEKYPTCYDEGEYAEDPACLPYDLTADPIAYSEHQLDVFADVQRKLLDMAVAPGEPYVRYGEAVMELLWKAQSLGLDLLLWLGGVSDANAHRGLDGSLGRPARQPVPAKDQRRALNTVLRILRPEESGLLPPAKNSPFLVWTEGMPIAGYVESLDIAKNAQEMVSGLLSEALSTSRVMQVYRAGQFPDQAGPALFQCGDYLAELVTGVLGKGLDVASPSEWRLHKVLVHRLKELYSSDKLPEEVGSHVMFHLEHISEVADAAHQRVSRSSTWQACANEGKEPCACKGLVRYGSDGAWSAAVAVSNATACNNSAFEDPAPNVRKRCECLVSTPRDEDLLRAHLSSLRKDLTKFLCQARGDLAC